MSGPRRFAAPPDVIYWWPRTPGHGDCFVSAIQLACGVTHDAALAACLKVKPDVLKNGMGWRTARQAIAALGYRTTLHVKRKGARLPFDLDDDAGILGIRQPHVADSDHVVYLWDGRVVEPKSDRCQMWLSARAFLSHYKYEPYGLLSLEPLETVS